MPRRLRHILEAQIGRREAQAEDVGVAEIADHAAGDQRLAERVGLRVAEGELAAALGWVGRADEVELQPLRGEAFAEEFGQRLRFGVEPRHADFRDQFHPDLERRHREDRRGAAQQAVDAGRRLVIVGEGEGCRVAHPAAERLLQRVVVALGDEGESGRAGTAVEIFVAAADREVSFATIEVDRQRAAGMRQVPQNQRPRCMRGAGQRRHVEQFAGLVMGMGQQ